MVRTCVSVWCYRPGAVDNIEKSDTQKNTQILRKTHFNCWDTHRIIGDLGTNSEQEHCVVLIRPPLARLRVTGQRAGVHLNLVSLKRH